MTERDFELLPHQQHQRDNLFKVALAGPKGYGAASATMAMANMGKPLKVNFETTPKITLATPTLPDHFARTWQDVQVQTVVEKIKSDQGRAELIHMLSLSGKSTMRAVNYMYKAMAEALAEQLAEQCEPPATVKPLRRPPYQHDRLNQLMGTTSLPVILVFAHTPLQ